MTIEWLTTVQAAEILGVSDDTIRRWIDAGRLRAREIARPGDLRTLRIRHSDLDAFMAEHVRDTIEAAVGHPPRRRR